MGNKYFLTELKEIFSVSKIVSLIHMKTLMNNYSKTHENFDFWKIQYNHTGNWLATVNGEDYHIGDGQVMFYSPNSTHGVSENLKKPEPCEIIVIGFVCNSPIMEYFREKIFTLTHEEKKILFNIARLKNDIFVVFDNDSEYRGIRPREGISYADLQFIKISLERFLLHLYNRSRIEFTDNIKKNKKNNDNDLASDVMDYLSENVFNNLKIDDIAKEFAVSTSTLKSTFKNATGKGIIDCFIDIKIDKAKEMIDNTSLTFALISEKLNFNSTSYFTRLFKKRTGMTPTEYSKITKKKIKFV
jgi:AraC-like DNA-binding protein